MELVCTLNGINFWVIEKDEVVVDRRMWAKVKFHLEGMFPMVSSATKPMEQCGTATNNASAEICHCRFGSILVELNNTGTVSKLNYCSMCGGKLSPVGRTL